MRSYNCTTYTELKQHFQTQGLLAGHSPYTYQRKMITSGYCFGHFASNHLKLTITDKSDIDIDMAKALTGTGFTHLARQEAN